LRGIGDQDDARLGVGEDVPALLGRERRVDRHRHRALPDDREVGDRPLVAILRQQRDSIAASEPQILERQRQALDVGARAGGGQGFPASLDLAEEEIGPRTALDGFEEQLDQGSGHAGGLHGGRAARSAWSLSIGDRRAQARKAGAQSGRPGFDSASARGAESGPPLLVRWREPHVMETKRTRGPRRGGFRAFTPRDRGRAVALLALGATLALGRRGAAAAHNDVEMGDLEYARGDLPAAAASYGAAVQARPASYPALWRLARVESEMGEDAKGDDQRRLVNASVEHARAAVKA